MAHCNEEWGALNKTWLLFRAYARQHYGIDLMDYCDVVFAAPPILNLKLQQRELDAVLNFWHYNARLQAMGYHSVMTLTELLQQMKLQGDDVPFIGWVFGGDFGDAHPSTPFSRRLMKRSRNSNLTRQRGKGSGRRGSG